MLCMLYYLCEVSQTTAYMKCKYLLILAGTNTAANEPQYLSNKTSKQTNRNICIKIEFQNSIERFRSFIEYVSRGQ